jgi:ElaA protein
LLAWRLVRFEDLTPRELHDIYRLRLDVFVVEQKCPFQDVDGADPECWHLLGTDSEFSGDGQPEKRGLSPVTSPAALVAYSRLLPPGTKFAEASIGRVVTTGAARRLGYGRQLMAESLRRAEILWPGRALRIGAQAYLEGFYASFGFVTASEPYDEDGIMHVEMVRPASMIPDRRGEKVGQ